MLNISRILTNQRQTSAMIGLTPDEFFKLIPVFEQIWIRAKKHQHEYHAARKIGGGRKGFLKTIEEKLFFELFYYKCYPTYDLLSAIYDCNRANACRRQHELSDLVEKTLGKKLVLPKRQMRTLEDFYKAFPEAKEILIDGTERPIQRPKDKQKQKDNYSGKKKRHTRKNLVITDKHKRVGFLGKTVSGKTHDFTMLKQQANPNHLPPKIKKHLDLGFTGFQKQFPNQNVSMPKRKPKNKVLSEFAVTQNKKKSSVRVLVENALAGVKRLNIVANVFRNRKEDFDDKVMLVSCGIWNYHLSMSC